MLKLHVACGDKRDGGVGVVIKHCPLHFPQPLLRKPWFTTWILKELNPCSFLNPCISPLNTLTAGVVILPGFPRTTSILALKVSCLGKPLLPANGVCWSRYLIGQTIHPSHYALDSFILISRDRESTFHSPIISIPHSFPPMSHFFFMMQNKIQKLLVHFKSPSYSWFLFYDSVTLTL